LTRNSGGLGQLDPAGNVLVAFKGCEFGAMKVLGDFGSVLPTIFTIIALGSVNPIP
jgi:hypothetical protein